MTNVNVKKTLYYTLMNALKPNKNLVIANDVYTGATVPHLVPAIRGDNCITAIPVQDIVQFSLVKTTRHKTTTQHYLGKEVYFQ